MNAISKGSDELGYLQNMIRIAVDNISVILPWEDKSPDQTKFA